ncbi:MAG: alpha/beta hydrolase [Sphingomonadales bacterium]|nr:alpha/beta hydrolase [Sphingomonadales bacterium]
MLAVSDVPRALLELSLLPASVPALRRIARGDGHPVLVLPGLLTSDLSTAILRRFLKSKGHDARAWKLGRNLGQKSVGQESEKIVARVREIHDAAERKVSLVGWSLGGIISRQIAQKMPELVRQVITLGSPFTGDVTATHATRIYERVSGDRYTHERQAQRRAEEAQPVPVPSTAIYSRYDGITAWKNCLEDAEDDQSENIELYGSHLGMTVNPAVLYLVAERLAQPEGEWQRFERNGWQSLFYPVRAKEATGARDHGVAS